MAIFKGVHLITMQYNFSISLDDCLSYILEKENTNLPPTHECNFNGTYWSRITIADYKDKALKILN